MESHLNWLIDHQYTDPNKGLTAYTIIRDLSLSDDIVVPDDAPNELRLALEFMLIQIKRIFRDLLAKQEWHQWWGSTVRPC